MAAAVALLLSTCLAGEVPAAVHSRGNIHNDGVTYTDYHVKISTTGAITGVSGTLSDDGTFYEGSVSGEGSGTVTVSFDGLDVPAGDAIGVAVDYTVDSQTLEYVVEYWTTGAMKAQVPTTALALNVSASGAFSLTNSYAQSIGYTGFQYTVAPAPYPGTLHDIASLLEGIAAGSPFNPGWTPLPDGTVPGNSQAHLGSAGFSANDYLQCYYGIEAFGGGSAGYVLDYQQVPIPIPATSTTGRFVVALLLLTAGAWTIMKWRRRRCVS